MLLVANHYSYSYLITVVILSLNSVCYIIMHLTSYIGAFIGNRYGAGNGQIWLDDVRCAGTEYGIDRCNHRAFGLHNCNHSQDVSITCRNIGTQK